MRTALKVFCFTFLMPLFGSSKGNFNDSTLSKWHFRLAPYAWLINIQGEVERPPEPPSPPPPAQFPEPDESRSVDLNFAEIRNTIKFAFILNGEYHSKKWVGSFDLVTFILEGDVQTPFGIVFQEATYRVGFFFGEANVGYKVFSEDKFSVSPTVGLRFSYVNLEAKTKIFNINNINLQAERSNDLLVPTFGIRTKYIPHPRFEFMFVGDISPFGPQNNLNYQLALLMNYNISRRFYASVGYRDLNFKSSQNDALYKGRIFGPVIRIGVQF